MFIANLNAIPEVDVSVGKWGRVNSALDPAPVSMYENVINYLPEFKVDEDGHKKRFKIDENNAFVLKDSIIILSIWTRFLTHTSIRDDTMIKYPVSS